ncbi:hypothetical protein [Caballeronia sp. AZ10_KS36]|uniref:hypothetical protein n=1 Tax=Caballeronia sp. AZ10_KS36 TaxID=2921757 RepID=UPI002029096A|nr:hypothetical protein [Caballeronia sp. AZ10_KS36]
MTIDKYGGWGSLPPAAAPSPTIAQTLCMARIEQDDNFDALTRAVNDAGDNIRVALANLNPNVNVALAAPVGTLLNDLKTLLDTTNRNIDCVAKAITSQPSLSEIATQTAALRQCVCEAGERVRLLAGIMNRQADWPTHLSSVAIRVLRHLSRLKEVLLAAMHEEPSEGLTEKLNELGESFGNEIGERNDIPSGIVDEIGNLYGPIPPDEYEKEINERLIALARVEQTVIVELA